MDPVKLHDNSLNLESKNKLKDKDSSDLDLTTDNRKRQFAYTAMILTFISIAIMILSIVANDNFGDDYTESFEMTPGNLPFRNETSSISNVNMTVSDALVRSAPQPAIIFDQTEPTFNSQGYFIEKKCSF